MTCTRVNEIKTRPAPPKKPLRLSLHRATSLQSVESAPPGSVVQVLHEFTNKKPTKRNHKGNPPSLINDKDMRNEKHGNLSVVQQDNQSSRTPSRAESCQSALRWPSQKSQSSHITSVPVEKWY